MNELEQERFFSIPAHEEHRVWYITTPIGKQIFHLYSLNDAFFSKNIEIFNNSRRKIRNQLIQLCSMHGQKEDI